LIDALSYEISWEDFAELLFVSGEGIMNLSEGHCPTLKPAVEHLFDSFEFTFALAALNG
jgi:hypothetical protein